MIEKTTTFLLCFTTFLFVYGCFRKILGVEDNLTFKTSMLILLISYINFASAEYLPMYMKSVVSILTYFCICKFVIKSNIYNSLVSSCIFFTLILIYELLLSIFIAMFEKTTTINYVESISLIKSIISLIVAIMIYNTLSFNIIKRYINYMRRTIEKLNIKIYYLILFPIVVLSIVYLYIFLLSPFENVIYVLLYIISIILLLAYIAFSIYRYFSINEMNSILRQNDEIFQSIINEYKMFKHNIRHELDCIRTVGNKKVNEILDTYFEEYYTTMNKTNDISKLPSGFQAIIYHKMIRDNKLNVNISVDNYFVTEPLKELSIKKYTKFIECVGIVIDNAIENIDNINNQYIYIMLTEDHSSYTFKCINYNIGEISVDMLFENSYSTKINHKGVGLNYLIQKTPFDIKTVLRDDKYIISIKVKK